MTRVFEQAVAKAKALSDQRQDEVGEMLLALVDQEHSNLRLSSAQEMEVRRRLGAADTFVPEQEMQDFFRKLAG